MTMCRKCDKEYNEESSSGSSGFCCKACEVDWWKQVATLKPTKGNPIVFRYPRGTRK